MIVDPKRVYDGWDSLAAGMDAGRRPSLIEANQCAKARDVVFRGGTPKSRPGIRQLTLEFENQIHYETEIDYTGGRTVLDANIASAVLLSDDAAFTNADVGALLISDWIPDGTYIVSINNPGSAVLSVVVNTAASDVAVTIVPTPIIQTGMRTVIDADITGAVLLSDTAIFTEADVGSFLISDYLPDGTTIVSITNPGSILMSSYATVTVEHVQVTIASSESPLFSTGTFHNKPFQCASYYVPSKYKECIMATFGGRLFQITPGVSTAKVREILLGERDPFPVSFTGSHTGNVITADDSIFLEEDMGSPVSGGNLPPNAVILTVYDGLRAALNVTPSNQSGITFTLNRKHAIPKRNRSTIKENFMVQADRWHITQDGESKPIIFDGVVARRAEEDEVIVGKIMAYGVGRLIVTTGNQIYFGDLFGSHAGDPSESVLKFTETKFLSEGFPAQIPYIQGNITAAAFFPSQDTATGQGELVIFTESGAVSFDLHLPRDKWKDSTFQSISLINSTAFGNRAVVMVNSDLWIRSLAGWRAYRQARAQSVGWYQLPQSTEVSPWTDADTPSLLNFGSAINFNNRLIVTCNPVPNNGRLYHNGMLSLDFNVLSSFGQATRPAWDGHWGKLKVLQLVSGTFRGEHRAFAFGLDSDNATQLYEITKNDREDFDGPITSEIEGRSHNFNAPFNEKNLYGADIWMDDTGPGGVAMELSFRPDSSASYLPWKTTSETLTPGDCGNITCGGVPTVGVGFAPRIKIGKPSDDCDEYTGRLNRRGYEFQPKLRWTGHASIRRMRLQAIQEEEDPKGEC